MEIKIGITTSFQDQEQCLHRTYVQAVEQAGGLPLIVPMLETERATRSFADLLDGLVITGGPAITEGLIGDLPDDISETDPVRVASDERILRAFLDSRKPILGICYGMQLLNATAGGSIYADVERQRGETRVHSNKRGADTHSIRLTPTSHLYTLLRTLDCNVNTRHIQAIASVGDGFQISATAPDGVVEAIENADGTVLGVQFHPERMGDTMLPLFRNLIAKARQRREAVPDARTVPV